MIIKISQDIGNAFDSLVILNIKINNSTGSNHEKLIAQYQILSAEIKSQIGEDKFNKVVISQEWKDLYKFNSIVFDLVDAAQNEKNGLAKETYLGNLNRYYAKKKLQEKWFGDEITEIKI